MVREIVRRNGEEIHRGREKVGAEWGEGHCRLPPITPLDP